MKAQLFFLALCTLCMSVGPAFASQTCGYERAFSVDGGSLRRVGDMLVVSVRGQAPGSGWTDARLAAVPDDTGPTKLAFRLIACAPPDGEKGPPSGLGATAYVVAQPGRLHDIVIRAATNELHLHDIPQQ